MEPAGGEPDELVERRAERACLGAAMWPAG
jgi:hypothetical protein